MHEFHLQFVESLNEALNAKQIALLKTTSLKKEQTPDKEMKEEMKEGDAEMELEEEAPKE